VGDEFEVLSSDKGSTNDIPTWARKYGHELVAMEEGEGYWSIRVRKTQ
jgi:TusA-related sulfurtransferase